MKSNQRLYILLLPLILNLGMINLNAQDLEQVGQENPIKVSGGFSAGFRGYSARGIDNRFDPFVWTASGNINLEIYGVLLPFSFLYSTQNSTFRQPFNRFGVTPYYKWVKLYLGYTSMNFSQFTFNNNSFLGGGVELTPDNKVRFSAVYGRLRQAVEQNFTNSFVIPSYKRMGYGFKIGYGTDRNHTDLILFSAYDDPNSLLVPDSLDVRPQENLVLALNSRYQITKNLGINFEIARSAINRDREAEPTETTEQNLANNLGGLFDPNITSEYYNAIQAATTYRLDKVDFELSYARIDPGYETLSTYFFNNDREEYSFNTGVRLINDKMYLRGGIGRQRNNLDEDESTTLERLAGNASLNYAFENGLNLSFSYTNFSSAVEYLIDEFQTDSLNYIQVSESYGINGNYTLRSGSVSQSVSFNGNYQLQNNESEVENPGLTNSALLNANGNYNINFIPSKLRLTFGINFNSNDISDIKSNRFGANLGANKSIFKNKVQFRAVLGGYGAYQDGNPSNTTINSRIGITYNVTQHHSFSGVYTMIQRNQMGDQGTSFSEHNSQINYKYRF